MSDKSETTLKPCPFCASKADIYVDGDGFPSVGCDKCPANMTNGAYIGVREIPKDISAELTEAWNRRAA